MLEQQIAFDDWQAEADKIDSQPRNTLQKQENLSNNPQTEIKTLDPPETNANQSVNWLQKMKKITSKEFERDYKDKQLTDKHIGQSPPPLKNQKDFVQLSKLVASRLKDCAQTETQRILPQNEIYTFFEQMLQYLYPNFEWQNLQYTKQKVRIVKKDRKEDEAKAKKQKQKQQRLKRAQKQPQSKKQHQTKINQQINDVSEKEQIQFNDQGYI